MKEYQPDLKNIQQITLSSPVDYLQVFNPLFRSFISSEKRSDPTYTIQPKYDVVDLEHVRETQSPNILHERPVHIKYAPLLDPLRYMIGHYDKEPEMDKQICFADEYPIHPTKYKDVNNASYVDAFFCYLSSLLLHEHGIQNAIDFYGCFAGVQQAFSLDILDDYEYLEENDEFRRKMKSGEIVSADYNLLRTLHHIGSHNNSRCGKRQIQLEEKEVDTEVDLLLGIKEMGGDETVAPSVSENPTDNKMVLEYEKQSLEYSDGDTAEWEDDDTEWEDDDDQSDAEKEENIEIGIPGGENNSGSDDNDDDDDDDDEEDKMMAQIRHFPVQLICLEKCEGTLDSLFCHDDDINSDICMAYAFQIVATLAAYQKAFSFTHNDLHTNNIVYCFTDKTHLYYRLFGKTYKVPTYGKIMKIIDFGRSAYRFQDRKMMSDGFSPSGDAYTQYNTEPYYNPRQPRIEENPSFDLCRLGCSIYDFIFDVEKETPVEKMDAFQRMVHRWCLDDEGKSVLYKKSGRERFPNFKLYKMIARIVHQHTPENQMPDFEMFLHEEGNDIPRDETGKVPIIDIDQIPALYW